MKAFPFAVMLSFAVVGCDDPGEGPKAARGYARAEPVINALAAFQRREHHYPDSLVQLVPAFLPDSALAVPTAAQERYPFEYRRDSGEFILTFRYVGPGMNRCSFTTPIRRWRCSGYY
jgi:hypothetical protein